MSNDTLWTLDVAEAMKDFFTNELSPQTVLEFMQMFDYGALEVTSAPMNAARIVLVHGNTDCSFTSDDIDWLGCASSVVKGDIDRKVSLFAIDVECDSEEYYLNCAALIKIFNKAFGGNNIYLFRIGQAMALGSMRVFSVDFPNNFCVTALIDASTINCMAELIHDLLYSDINDFPEICINYSPQEEHWQYKVYRENIIEIYSEESYEEDVIDDMLGPRHKYGLLSMFEDPDENEIHLGIERYTYRQVCELLKDVAAFDDSSSYNDLDIAKEAEEYAQANQTSFSSFDDTSLHEQPDLIDSRFSQNAYDNAATMLQEMNRKESKE